MVTYIILGITVLASFYAWNNPEVYHRWMLNPYDVKRKNQYYRFITSGLIHGDHMHLFFNMLTLYFFRGVEDGFMGLYGYWGIPLYLLLYIGGMIISDIPSFLKNQKNPAFNSLGASGAISAVVFSGILFNPLMELNIFFILPITAFIYAILYLIYSYYQGKQLGDGINHDAHFYGALFGLAFTIIVYPPIVPFFFKQLGHWQMFKSILGR